MKHRKAGSGRSPIFEIMKPAVWENKIWFLALGLILSAETGLALLLPEIQSIYIDRLDLADNMWLAFCALGYCFTVLVRGCISICNTCISESLGWKLCDHLRADLFKRIFSFDVQYHKTVQEGFFLECMEGDINFLTGFFSSMLVDILGSLLMVTGVLVVFFTKYALLGSIFTVLSLAILVMFAGSQNAIASLWKKDRERETDVLDGFTQAVAARKDILGIGKTEYVRTELEHKYTLLEKAHARASFLGNIPATVFFSLLNAGEGIALAAGIFLLGKGRMTIGEIYLILSYVGLLNAPFFSLKYEFTQIPKVLASLGRINGIYGSEGGRPSEGVLQPSDDKSVVFRDVSFCYHPQEPVLKQVSFEAAGGEHLSIEGRTGSGKSTILQLIAGFYSPDSGELLVGGRHIGEYRQEDYDRYLYYILQNNPILEDTVRNNVTRYDDRFSDDEIREALRKVSLGEWLEEKENGLDERMNPTDTPQDEAQLLAWAGALLRRPGILLADEFDAVIHEDTIRTIDKIVSDDLKDTTVILVTHQNRSDIHIHTNILMENGRIVKIDRENKMSGNG